MAKDFTKDFGAALSGLQTGNRFDGAKVQARTKSIQGRGYKLDVDIHAVACATLFMAMPEGLGGNSNCEPARQLLMAMPKGSRAKTLCDWFAAHSNIVLKQGKDGKWSVGLDKSEARKDDDALPALAKAAMDKPFWTVEEKTKGPEAFDIYAQIAVLMKKADKAIKSGQIDEKNLAAFEKFNAFAVAEGLVPAAQ